MSQYRRSVFAALAFGICLSTLSAQSVLGAANIIGDWTTESGDTIRISQCGEAPCGQIHRFTPPPGRTMETTVDERNRDASKRGRKLLGLTILWRLKPDGQAWVGRIYDPRRGFSAKADVALRSSNSLRVRGCAKVLFKNICQSETWHRAR